MFVMEKKKNKKANLENYRRLFLMVGLLVSIGIVGSLFSWKSSNAGVEIMSSFNNDIEDELVPITEKKQKEKVIIEPIKNQHVELMKIVVDETEVEVDFNIDVEIGEKDPIEIIPIDEPDPEPVHFKIHIVVEKKPEYPGGLLALRRHIANNIIYPATARENDIHGTVHLRFVVLKTGLIGDIEVIRGEDPLLDNEAIRVIKTLKKFKPGQQGGKNVSVWYSLPIVFKLN